MNSQIHYLFWILLLFIIACNTDNLSSTQSNQNSSTMAGVDLPTGIWQGKLKLTDTETLPFNFELSKKDQAYVIDIINGEERITLKEISVIEDSVIMQLPVFNSAIKAKFAEGRMLGKWHNYAKSADYEIPFSAMHDNDQRFEVFKAEKVMDVDGKWEVVFITEDNSGKTDAIGEFQQNKQQLTGTFLTPTGDFRYLEGSVFDNEMMLSCFDGSHAFLFKAKMNEGGSLHGEFWSGNHWYEKWIAYRNDSVNLPDPDTLTYLKEGYDKIDFSFPNLNGQNVSINTPKYKDKVVLVQVLGSWCPNCMDETAFYADYYKKHKDKGLEIIGVAFEMSDELSLAKPGLERYIKHFDIQYDILLGGKASKSVASAALPMLNKVISFPTTIFIDRKGKVRKIHTGFSGPATSEYKTFTNEFDTFVQDLLGEEIK